MFPLIQTVLALNRQSSRFFASQLESQLESGERIQTGFPPVGYISLKSLSVRGTNLSNLLQHRLRPPSFDCWAFSAEQKEGARGLNAEAWLSA